MITYAIEVDQSQLAAAEQDLANVENGLATATSRAVRRTAEQVKTLTLRAITRDVNILRKDIDADSPQAHRYGGVSTRVREDRAVVSVTGWRIPLYRFGGRPQAPPTPRGVSYSIDRGGGRKKITSNAFVAVMGSGHVGFYSRGAKLKPTGRTIKHGPNAGKPEMRQQIYENFGPSIPQVAITSPELSEALEVDAAAMFESNLARQVAYLAKEVGRA